MSTPSFADLAARFAPSEVAAVAAPNVDSSMRLAPDDLTDHPRRIADARVLAAAKAAAVVSAHRAIDVAISGFGEGVDPGAYGVDDEAWSLVDEGPAEIEIHRREALAEAADEDPDNEDPDALVAIEASHDLAMELRSLLAALQEVDPNLESYELLELVEEQESVDQAKQAEARILARHDAAAILRRSVDEYARALHAYLARWPKKERGDEEERLWDLVFGE